MHDNMANENTNLCSSQRANKFLLKRIKQLLIGHIRQINNNFDQSHAVTTKTSNF